MRVSGRLSVPGDKSLSHRALMIAALVPINMLMARFIPGPYMDALVAEEAHQDEEKHTLD